MNFYKFVLKLFTLYSKTFYKYEVIGAENVPDEGNIILAANHKSALDPIFVSIAIKNREIATIAKKELFNNKLLGKILTKLHVIPIDRDNPGISSIKTILKKIKEGYAIGIFPEGTINKTDDITMRFKTGAIRMAYETNSEIVPFAITGKYKIFRKSVKIIYGKPYKVHSNDFRKETDILRSKVNKLIIGGEWYGYN